MNLTQRQNFIQEGIDTYFDVTRAIHLFQTEVAKDLKDVLENQNKRIKKVMQLKKDVPEISRDVWPDFPEDDWSYDNCDISASVWLDDPQWATLYLGIRFTKDEDGKPTHNLICVGEVGPKHRWRKWQGIFKGHKGYFDEEWDGYAIGLSRSYISSQDLKQESTLLLDDFFSCIEQSTTRDKEKKK